MTAMLEALERLQGTAAEFGGFLANHGPMAADAMIRLGRDDLVGRWIDRYVSGLEPAPPTGDVVDGRDWAGQLGRFELVGDWTAHFQRTIHQLGWREIVDTWWPRLLPGAAASATHGLLRTAHAVRNLAELGDVERPLIDELAAGLGFWAARFQRLPGDPHLSGPLDLGSALARIPRLGTGVRGRGPGIGGRLAALSDLDELPHAMDEWGPAGDATQALDGLISRAARILIARSDAPLAFCHAVTAPAAIRMILPELAVAHHRSSLAASWQLVASIVAAFAAAPDPPRLRDAVDASRPADLAAAAVDHGDEHVMKLTEACIRQSQVTGDEVLLQAAEVFRGRIAPRW